MCICNVYHVSYRCIEHARICIYVCIHGGTVIHTYISLYEYVHNHRQSHTHVYIYIYMYTYTCIHIYTNQYMCVKHITCIYKHTTAYTYIYIYMYTLCRMQVRLRFAALTRRTHIRIYVYIYMIYACTRAATLVGFIAAFHGLAFHASEKQQGHQELLAMHHLRGQDGGCFLIEQKACSRCKACKIFLRRVPNLKSVLRHLQRKVCHLHVD